MRLAIALADELHRVGISAGFGALDLQTVAGSAGPLIEQPDVPAGSFANATAAVAIATAGTPSEAMAAALLAAAV